MLNFKEYLKEDLSKGSLNKVANIVLRYLRKKVSKSVFSTAGVEAFKNSGGAGYGLRFYIPDNLVDSIRFNWTSIGSASSVNLSSIDIWKRNKKPIASIKFESGVNLSQVLPQIADIAKTANLKKYVKGGTFYSLPKDIDLNESIPEDTKGELLNEDQEYLSESTEIFDSVISLITSPNFNKSKVWKIWKSAGVKIFDEIARQNPDLIQKSGRAFVWAGSDADVAKIAAQRDNILNSVGVVKAKVSAGSSSENYLVDSEVEQIEQNRERISFEKQLEDLKNLVKLMASGASNALFVAGRGGVGKTHTVEAMLAEMGLSDGSGYFKNTGTASAVGIYSLLFKHQNDIVFFDDSDGALKDQDARNIFKAATDTKKIRKLVWNKASKNIVDPEDYEGSAEEMLDDGKIPRWFNFTGKVIFISNLNIDRLDPDKALRTRAFMIEIDPTEMEIYDFMEKIVDRFPIADGLSLDTRSRKHVVTLLRKGKSKQSANLRKLSRALNMQAGAFAAGVKVSDSELTRMIETYA